MMVSLLKMRKSGDNLVPVLRGQYIKGLRTGIKAVSYTHLTLPTTPYV